MNRKYNDKKCPSIAAAQAVHTELLFITGFIALLLLCLLCTARTSIADFNPSIGEDIQPFYQFHLEKIGEYDYDEYGSSIACKDNRFLIGIPGKSGGDGAVEVLNMSTDQESLIYSPPGGVGSNFGSSVDFIGNLIGNPGPNLLIGAPYTDSNGSVFAYTGAEAGGLTSTAPSYGSDYENFGKKVKDLKDIVRYNSQTGYHIMDPDGSTEVLISAPEYGYNSTYAGRVVIWDLEHESEVGAIYGADGERLGFALDTIEDLNNDGNPEILVGAPGYNSFIGALKIYSYEMDYSFLNMVELKVISGASLGYYNYRFGSSVANVGRVDNDTVSDVLVGMQAVGEVSPGRAVLYSGGSLTGNPVVLCEIVSPAPTDSSFGRVVAGLGNIDGLPGDEFAIAAPDYSRVGVNNGGRVYIYSYNNDFESGGSGDCVLRGAVRGPSSDYSAGIAIQACDYNLDGFMDLAIGTGVSDQDGGAGITGSVAFYMGQEADHCPADPEKTAPGDCGCGIPDTDSDDDGTADCLEFDYCPEDEDKTLPGICGCGIPDVDDNGNGVVDCNEDDIDLCPNDDYKLTPGVCGCGLADDDADGNGTIDCLESDQCPEDPDKELPGICGCGEVDGDSDGDGVPDCSDECPYDAEKVLDGICACGAPAHNLRSE